MLDKSTLYALKVGYFNCIALIFYKSNQLPWLMTQGHRELKGIVSLLIDLSCPLKRFAISLGAKPF